MVPNPIGTELCRAKWIRPLSQKGSKKEAKKKRRQKKKSKYNRHESGCAFIYLVATCTLLCRAFLILLYISIIYLSFHILLLFPGTVHGSIWTGSSPIINHTTLPWAGDWTWRAEENVTGHPHTLAPGNTGDWRIMGPSRPHRGWLTNY